MKKLVSALIIASVSAISAPSFGADWLSQMEQTRRFQKKAAEKRAAKEREAAAKSTPSPTEPRPAQVEPRPAPAEPKK